MLTQTIVWMALINNLTAMLLLPHIAFAKNAKPAQTANTLGVRSHSTAKRRALHEQGAGARSSVCAGRTAYRTTRIGRRRYQKFQTRLLNARTTNLTRLSVRPGELAGPP